MAKGKENTLFKTIPYVLERKKKLYSSEQRLNSIE